MCVRVCSLTHILSLSPAAGLEHLILEDPYVSCVMKTEPKVKVERGAIHPKSLGLFSPVIFNKVTFYILGAKFRKEESNSLCSSFNFDTLVSISTTC